ncbi:MAG: hypothetical protein KDK70_42065, partial [Myxococcales bacterium]|nr:hypothetical protein [Myxococcales bacterium]
MSRKFVLAPLTSFALGIASQACGPDLPEPVECYATDPNGDWPVNPIVFSSNYCGRGRNSVAEPLEARMEIWCIDEPAT